MSISALAQSFDRSCATATHRRRKSSELPPRDITTSVDIRSKKPWKLHRCSTAFTRKSAPNSPLSPVLPTLLCMTFLRSNQKQILKFAYIIEIVPIIYLTCVVSSFFILLFVASAIMFPQSDLVVNSSRLKPEAVSQAEKQLNDTLIGITEKGPRWYEVRHSGQTCS